MRFPRNHQVFKGRFDGAAFACVFFPLLLFLLLNQSLVYQPGYLARVPSGENISGYSGPFLVVTVDSVGRIFYDSQWIEEQELVRRLRAEVDRIGEDLKLIVTLDQELRYADTLKIVEIAKSAGIQEVIWSTRPPFYGRSSSSSSSTAPEGAQ